jgi:hypothetical protein
MAENSRENPRKFTRSIYAQQAGINLAEIRMTEAGQLG